MSNFYVPNQQGEKALVVLRQPSQMHLQGCQSYKPFFGFCIPFNHEICLDQKLPEGTHPLSQATVVLYPICPQPSFDYCILAKTLTYIWVGQLTRAFSSWSEISSTEALIHFLNQYYCTFNIKGQNCSWTRGPIFQPEKLNITFLFFLPFFPAMGFVNSIIIFLVFLALKSYSLSF